MKYYVNRNPNTSGQREVHTEFCGFLPSPTYNRVYLGNFSECTDALDSAIKLYGKVTYCSFCCKNKEK